MKTEQTKSSIATSQFSDMDTQSSNPLRPRFFEDPIIWDNAHNYSSQTPSDKSSIQPAECAIFVVHGMGEQTWVETAAILRAGLEDVVETPKSSPSFAAPFIYDGYWANYNRLYATFPNEWSKLNKEGEKCFFKRLWETRPFSIRRTIGWFTLMQFQLITTTLCLMFNCQGVWTCLKIRFKKFQGQHLDNKAASSEHQEKGTPSSQDKDKFAEFCKRSLSLLVYFSLLLFDIILLYLALVFRRQFIVRYLSDVRLYCTPKGAIEKAIVQRIDKRVADKYLELIGLDVDFRKLPPCKKLKVAGQIIDFKRIVWVSHSWGTIISYNVLSDLFTLADRFERNGDSEQKDGVAHFRNTLQYFITMASPLDKISVLLGNKVLRPWPNRNRQNLLTSKDEKDEPEWWINFYDICDPVSGPLSEKLICSDKPPLNHYIGAGLFPGFAHNIYWKDPRTLKYILEMTFGKSILAKQQLLKPKSETLIAFVTAIVYLLSFLVVVLRICSFLGFQLPW